ERYASYVDTFAAFAGKRHSESDQAAIQAAHDAIVEAGATCAGANMHKETHMKLFDKDWWAALFGGAKAAGLEGVGFAAAREPATTTTDDPRIAALERQLADQRRTQIEGQAASFADGAIRDRRALPSERQALYDAYLQAASDDAAHGAVTFADGKEGSRIAGL